MGAAPEALTPAAAPVPVPVANAIAAANALGQVPMLEMGNVADLARTDIIVRVPAAELEFAWPLVNARGADLIGACAQGAAAAGIGPSIEIALPQPLEPFEFMGACARAGLLMSAIDASGAARFENGGVFFGHHGLLSLCMGDSFTTVGRFEHDRMNKLLRINPAAGVRAAADRADGTAALSLWCDPWRCCGGGGNGSNGSNGATPSLAPHVIDDTFVLVDRTTGHKFALAHGTALVSWDGPARYAVKPRHESPLFQPATLVELRFYLSKGLVDVCRDDSDFFASYVSAEWHGRMFGGNNKSSGNNGGGDKDGRSAAPTRMSMEE
jgi:hypothetical protein